MLSSLVIEQLFENVRLRFNFVSAVNALMNYKQTRTTSENLQMNISYDPFNPVFSSLAKPNSRGYSLEERSQLMLKKHAIGKQSVWLMMGLSFVEKEDCFYARKMWNSKLILNKKFYLQSVEGETRNQILAKAILKATRELHQCNQNLPAKSITSTPKLKAKVNISIKPEREKYFTPSIVVTIYFSGLKSKAVRFSKTLNHFNSEHFIDFYSQVKQYTESCIEQQSIITFTELPECTTNAVLVQKEGKALLKNAFDAYITKHIPSTFVSNAKIIKDQDGYQFSYNDNHKKVYLNSAYFNDTSLIEKVMHINSYHCFLKDAEQKNALSKEDLLIASCCHKVQPSSGVCGVVVRLDRRAQKLLVGGIIGKTTSGSYRTKNITVSGNLKSAFDYAIDEHIKAFNLPTLSKKQRHDLYVTLQGSVLVQIPSEYLLPISTILEGVEVITSPKVKPQPQLKSEMPQYESLFERVISKPFKKTGLCGVNIEVNRGTSNVIAIVGVCPKKGRIYKTYSIRAYGLNEAFILALSSYRKGFKLPTLSKSEIEDLYSKFSLTISETIPTRFQYKLK